MKQKFKVKSNLSLDFFVPCTVKKNVEQRNLSNIQMLMYGMIIRISMEIDVISVIVLLVLWYYQYYKGLIYDNKIDLEKSKRKREINTKDHALKKLKSFYEN